MGPQQGFFTLAKQTSLGNLSKSVVKAPIRLSSDFVSRFGWWEIGEIGHLCQPVSQESGLAGDFLGEPLPYNAGQHSESQPAPGPSYRVTHKFQQFPKKRIKRCEGIQHLPATRTGFHSVVPDHVSKIK